jgi:hypothetical protein
MNKLLSLSRDNAFKVIDNYIDDLSPELANKMLKVLMTLQINKVLTRDEFNVLYKKLHRVIWDFHFKDEISYLNK